MANLLCITHGRIVIPLRGGVMDGNVISVDLPMTFKLRGRRKVILLPVAVWY
jgi:hypothetical protein